MARHCCCNDFRLAIEHWFSEDQLRLTIKTVHDAENKSEQAKLTRGGYYRTLQRKTLKARNDWLVKQAERKMVYLLKKRGCHIRQVFNQLDRNRDGTISLKELADALKSLARELESNPDPEKQGKAATDTDTEGAYHALPAVKKEPVFTENTVALLLANAGLDENGDHRIDFPEFKHWSQKVMAAQGVIAARRGSMEAMRLARHKLWNKARRELVSGQKQFKSLLEAFRSVNIGLQCYWLLLRAGAGQM